MLSKNKIKFIKSLHLKKYRFQQNRFIVEGDKIVKECLNVPNKLLEIYALPNWLEKYAKKIPKSIEVYPINERELKSISQLRTPNQVLAILDLNPFVNHEIDTSQQIYLYLDGIRDPGNLGTILRTSEWFGFTQVLCSDDCVELFKHKTIQATMGSFLRVKLLPFKLSELRNEHPSWKIFATSMHVKSIYQTQFNEKSIIIIGNEGNGISQEGFRLADQNISIPKTTDTAIDSLNAAVSAALVMSYIKAN